MIPFRYDETLTFCDTMSEKIKQEFVISHEVVTTHLKCEHALPIFILGSASETAKQKLNNDRETIPPLSVTLFKQASIVGRGVHLTQDNRPIVSAQLLFEEHQLTGSPWTANNSVANLIAKKNSGLLASLRVKEPCICIARGGDHIYGHWLIDIMPRIFFAKRQIAPDITWILAADTPPFVQLLLKLLHVPENKIIKYDPLTQYIDADYLYVATYMRYHNFLHPLFNRMVEEILTCIPNSDEMSFERVYISRANWKNEARRLINRDEVEGIFSEFDFKVVQPELLPIAQQIGLFANARFVSGEAGSGLHNTMYGKDNCNVIVLQSNASFSFLQNAVCHVRGQKVGYIFGEAFDRKGNIGYGDFIIDPKAVKKGLDILF